MQKMQIQKTYQERLAEIEAKIKDAQQNFGETEIRDAILLKGQFYLDNKNNVLAIETFQIALKKTIQIGRKMDICFKLICIYLGEENIDKVKEYIDECYGLLEKGGDWERKNKLKVYEGIYLLITRDFKGANKQFVDVLPTFNAVEVINYEKLVFYATVTGIISMSRPDIKKKIIQSSEVIMYLMKMPELKEFIESFYNSRYRQFFLSFLQIIEKVKQDSFMKMHSKYFIRETRVVIYGQFLESYKTVKISSMAAEFGVSVEFIDNQLSELISARRLPCKIDKVAGIIETDRTDQRNRFYKEVLKKGDHLLNQIQKLSRTIDV